MPVVYGLNSFGLCFATIASLFLWLFLEKRQSIMLIVRSAWADKWQSQAEKSNPKAAEPYASAPTWWYGIAALCAIGLGIFACEYYPVQLRWYGALFAFAISLVFFLPVGFPL